MVHPVITSARPYPPVPPGASSLAPIPSVAVVPTLRAAHYLYYQRVEQDPEGDPVASQLTVGSAGMYPANLK